MVNDILISLMEKQHPCIQSQLGEANTKRRNVVVVVVVHKLINAFASRRNVVFMAKKMLVPYYQLKSKISWLSNFAKYVHMELQHCYGHVNNCIET